MPKRKTLSNKIRFEVFKRDNFTCQYCGKKAPDVVLNVDHIEPVSKGGTNDIMNLITSCFECNNGKRDRKLSDTTVIDKQRDELEVLNERKQQIELMMQWKKELLDFKNVEVEKIAEYFEEVFDCKVEPQGLKKMKSWLRKYSIHELISAIDTAYDVYYDKGTHIAFDKVPRIAYYNRNPVKTYVRNASYIRGILKNRGLYYNDRQLKELMKDWYEQVDEQQYQEVIDAAVNSTSWTRFRNEILNLIEGAR